MEVVPEFEGKKFELSNLERIEKEKYVALKFTLPVKKGKTTRLFKFASVTSSMNYDKEILAKKAYDVLEYATEKGYEALLFEQERAWKNKWQESDIVIEGDVSAQQGIRFNIFQLNQTYTGQDERLNIGPKGFTGEKYGGSTYWDTEAYLLPFYLSTADEKVSKQLLKYRYNHLEKAIENAEKLGFNTGAALYPMVTMNGEECHNEWEITFEEIHRYGLEVLIGISRFWAQRVNFSEEKQKYVMLGVTGPNEYENNVNNNWYSNTLVCKTLKYTEKVLQEVEETYPKQYSIIIEKVKFNKDKELSFWKKIYNNMYFPYDEKRKIFLQQDGFLDKEIKPVSELSHLERPIHQHWSWDRILRSCYIKQADVTIRRNFDFYEPLTVHESSLSSCVHSILAAKIGDKEKAYQFYLNAARLDLDDYNNDTEDGLHITSMGGTWMTIVKGFSMGGTWMTIVKGFGGMRIKDNKLSFAPFIPEQWKSYAFKIRFRGSLLNIEISKEGIKIKNESNKDAEITLFEKNHEIKKDELLENWR